MDVVAFDGGVVAGYIAYAVEKDAWVLQAERTASWRLGGEGAVMTYRSCQYQHLPGALLVLSCHSPQSVIRIGSFAASKGADVGPWSV